jgi:hypothetical protein
MGAWGDFFMWLALRGSLLSCGSLFTNGSLYLSGSLPILWFSRIY